MRDIRSLGGSYGRGYDHGDSARRGRHALYQPISKGAFLLEETGWWEVESMTSVPLSFWPNNLSSLFWVFICGSLIVGAALDQAGMFDVEWRNIIAWSVMICACGFVIDQLILGPIWWYKNGRNL